MIRILSTQDSASQIRDIISQASKIVVLISPFLDDNSDIFDYLEGLRAKSYSVPVFVITRTPAQTTSVKMQKKALKRLSSIKDCFVHYCPNLHAKCYFNETDMVITSLNMLSKSEQNNFELGIHINIYDFDGKPFRDAWQKVNEICRAAIPVMNQIDSSGNFVHTPIKAFCINSGEPNEFQGETDPESNVTQKYIERSRYKDLKRTPEVLSPDHPQYYCHLCGRSYEDNKDIFKAPPTLEQPFCDQCASFVSAVSFDNFRI